MTVLHLLSYRFTIVLGGVGVAQLVWPYPPDFMQYAHPVFCLAIAAIAFMTGETLAAYFGVLRAPCQNSSSPHQKFHQIDELRGSTFGLINATTAAISRSFGMARTTLSTTGRESGSEGA